MPDSDLFISDDEVTEFKITVACECYSSLDLVRDELTQLPDFNGELVWGSPCTPDPHKLMRDAEVVLIVSDRASLLMAIGRALLYKQSGQAHILIYLQDEIVVPDDAIPGLILPRSQLATGLFDLIQMLFAPVIPEGLVGIDWADVLTILAMGDQIVMEKASGSQPEGVIEAAVTQLRSRASGRVIHGLQASFLCSPYKLLTRYPRDLMLACKDTAGENTSILVAAPLLDWPDTDYYEVRLFAKVECTTLPG